MDLDELRALLAVADTGSLLAAAERLGLPRSTLRRRLDGLEAHAGVPLLARNAQGARLTPAGELIAAGGRRLLQEASALITAARDTGPSPTGVVRVAIPVGMAPHAMLPMFVHARESWPQLEFDVRVFEDPLAGLAGEVDIAFVVGSVLPPGPYITRVMVRMQEQLLASRTYLDRRGRPQSVQDLAQHELFLWRAPGEDPRRLPMRTGGSEAVASALVISDIHAVRSLALLGHGIAFVPDAGLPDPDYATEPLEPVLPQLVGRDCALRVFVPEALARSPKVRALQQMVLAIMG